MIEQLKTIREFFLLPVPHSPQDTMEYGRAKVRAEIAVAQIEAMVGAQEPVAKLHDDGYWTPMKTEAGRALNERLLRAGSPSIEVYTAAPVAQQYEAGDMASAAAQGFRDGVASVAQQPQKLEDIEQYRMQMAGICTAAIGYWKEGDPIHLDYDTPALRDVAKLYSKYDALYKAQQPQSVDWEKLYRLEVKKKEALAVKYERDTGKKLTRIVPMAQQPQAEAVSDIHEAQGQIEFLDRKNNALSAAIRKVMARLADLLDEDQFKEIEEIVSFAGVQPQAEEVPLTHVLVPVDEPTDEMVDAACAAVDGLCRVDFVRAYVAAFAHLKAGYRDESYWCGWNAAIKFQQAEAVPVVDRVYEAAKRLVDHADFQLGGVLSAKSKARDIPSNAASKVKARHLASLRDALAKTPQQAEAVQYTRADLDRAYSAGLVEGERLAIQQAEAGPTGFKHACYLWVDPETNKYEVDHFEHHLSELTPAYIKVAALAQQKGGV